MTLAKIDPNAPIIYGGSCISPSVAGSGQNFYYDPARVKSFTTMDTAFTQNLDGRYLGGDWLPEDPFPMASGDHVAGTSGNLEVAIAYSGAGPKHKHWLSDISWGYDATPAASGRITVEDGLGNVIWGEPVTTSGPGEKFFGEEGKIGSPNTPMYIRLTAGGTNVKGEVSANHRIL